MKIVKDTPDLLIIKDQKALFLSIIVVPAFILVGLLIVSTWGATEPIAFLGTTLNTPWPLWVKILFGPVGLSLGIVMLLFGPKIMNIIIDKTNQKLLCRWKEIGLLALFGIGRGKSEDYNFSEIKEIRIKKQLSYSSGGKGRPAKPVIVYSIFCILNDGRESQMETTFSSAYKRRRGNCGKNR